MKVDVYIDYKFQATAEASDAEAFYAVADIEGTVEEFGRCDSVIALEKPLKGLTAPQIQAPITFVEHGDPAPGPIDFSKIEGR